MFNIQRNDEYVNCVSSFAQLIIVFSIEIPLVMDKSYLKQLMYRPIYKLFKWKRNIKTLPFFLIIYQGDKSIKLQKIERCICIFLCIIIFEHNSFNVLLLKHDQASQISEKEQADGVEQLIKRQ